MKDLIKKILKERSGVSDLSTSTPKTYSNKAGDTINDIKANGCKKTSVKDAVPRLDELSKETLGSYISKADKEVHDLNKKSARSKNLQRTYDLLVKVQKRRKGYSTATTKLSRKLAGERWGIKESIDIKEIFDTQWKIKERDISKLDHSSDQKAGIKNRKVYDVIDNGEFITTFEKNGFTELHHWDKDTNSDGVAKPAPMNVKFIGTMYKIAKELVKSGKKVKIVMNSSTKPHYLQIGVKLAAKEGFKISTPKKEDDNFVQFTLYEQITMFGAQGGISMLLDAAADIIAEGTCVGDFAGIESYLKLDEAMKAQEVQITVPALIRLCEIAREDIDGDTDLHEFIEALIEKSNGTIDSQSIEDIESSDDDNDEDDIDEGEIVSADKKVGADGRLYPRSKKTIGKSTDSLTGVKLS